MATLLRFASRFARLSQQDTAPADTRIGGVLSGSSQARTRDDHRALRLARCPLPPRSDGARVRATRRGGSELVRSGRERGARGDARIVDEREPLDGDPQIGVEGDSGAAMRRRVAGPRHRRAGRRLKPRAATALTFRSRRHASTHATSGCAVAPAAPRLPLACAAARVWFGGWHAEAAGVRSRSCHEAVTVC
jgi:hypothetical protein